MFRTIFIYIRWRLLIVLALCVYFILMAKDGFFWEGFVVIPIAYMILDYDIDHMRKRL